VLSLVEVNGCAVVQKLAKVVKVGQEGEPVAALFGVALFKAFKLVRHKAGAHLEALNAFSPLEAIVSERAKNG
jgi:hypothetical protein